jgi:hypothetical protein
VVNCTPRPLYPRERDPVPIVQEAGWAPGPVWKGAKNLAPTGIRSPNHPVRIESLYRLRYPGPKVEHIVDEIQSCQNNWLQHVKRMEHSRTPRMAMDYKPKDKRDIDRPKTRCRNQQHLQDGVLEDRTQVSYICLRS